MRQNTAATQDIHSDAKAAPQDKSQITPVSGFRVYDQFCETLEHANVHKLLVEIADSIPKAEIHLIEIRERGGSERFRALAENETGAVEFHKLVSDIESLSRLLGLKQFAGIAAAVENDRWQGAHKLSQVASKFTSTKGKTLIEKAFLAILPAELAKSCAEEFDYYLERTIARCAEVSFLDRAGRVWATEAQAALRRNEPERTTTLEQRMQLFDSAVERARAVLPQEASELVFSQGAPSYQWDPQALALYKDAVAEAFSVSERYFDLGALFLANPHSYELWSVRGLGDCHFDSDKRIEEQQKTLKKLSARLRSFDFGTTEYNRYDGAAARIAQASKLNISSKLNGEILFTRGALGDTHGWTEAERTQFPYSLNHSPEKHSRFIRGLVWSVRASEHFSKYFNIDEQRLDWKKLSSALAWAIEHCPHEKEYVEAAALWPLVYRARCFGAGTWHGEEKGSYVIEYRSPHEANQRSQF